MPPTLQLAKPLLAPGRIPAIDQLKGLALVLVLLYHGGGILGLPNSFNGQVGVDIFIVLSGFALALGSIELSAADFFRRRFFRIFPPYWAALALFIGLAHWTAGDTPTLLDLILHVTGLHGFGNDALFFAWSDSFWFIGLIVPLYLLLFLIRRWVDRLDVLGAVAGLATVLMAYYATAAHHLMVVSHLPMRIPMFFLGVAAGRFALGKPLRIHPGIWLMVGGAATYAYFFVLNQSLNGGLASLGLILGWLGFARLISAAAPGRWFLGAFAYLGTISYELYLFHQPLMGVYNRDLLGFLFGWSNPSLVQLFLGMMAMLAGLVLLATLWKQARATPNAVKAPRSAPALSVLALLAAVAVLGFLQLQPGRLVLQIQHFQALEAGVCEPLVYVGQNAGAADLIYLKHEPNNRVRFGIDHWGAARIEGEPIECSRLEGRDLSFELSAVGITVKGPGGIIFQSAAPPYDWSGSWHVGRNDIGFSTAVPLARSTIRIVHGS